MYEVEIKVELSDGEKMRLLELFKEKNFAFKGVTPQNDYYVEVTQSPYGGYDFKRYRDEGGKFIYTAKTQEKNGDELARREDEHEVSMDEFASRIAEFPEAVRIKKEREWFAGNYRGRNISITIDSLKFDHSPSVWHFIEAEIDTEDKNEVSGTRSMLKEFLQELLGTTEITEAPGMFTMAFKKR